MSDHARVGSACPALAALVPALLAATAVLDQLRRRFFVAAVRGSSMSPTLVDGDRVLVRRSSKLAVGDLVVFTARRPADAFASSKDVPTMIKRIAALPGDRVPVEFRPPTGPIRDAQVPRERLLVRGDNSHTEDSRAFGYLRSGEVLGVGVRCLRGGRRN